MHTAEELVREFCDVLSNRDPDAIRGYLTEDAVYQNVGMAPNVGADAVVADLANQFQMFTDNYRFDIKHLAVNGDVVLTERVDYVGGKDMTLTLPVMGAFIVRDGKISRWTDYFDSALIGKILGGEDISGLVPSGY